MNVEERPGLLNIKLEAKPSIGPWLLLVFFVLPWTAIVLTATFSEVLASHAESNAFEFAGAVLGFVSVLAFTCWFIASIVFDQLGTEEITITGTELTLIATVLGMRWRRAFLLDAVTHLFVEERFHSGKTQGRTSRRLRFLYNGKLIRGMSTMSHEDSSALLPLLTTYAPSCVPK